MKRTLSTLLAIGLSAIAQAQNAPSAPNATEIVYTYDTSGRLATAHVGNSAKQTFTFDKAANLKGVVTVPQTISTLNIGGVDYLAITFTRANPAPANLNYTVQVSADGQTWTTNTVEVSNATSGNLSTIVVRDSVPATGRKIRLLVTPSN